MSYVQHMCINFHRNRWTQRAGEGRGGGENVVRPENVKPEAVFVIQITRLVCCLLCPRGVWIISRNYTFS